MAPVAFTIAGRSCLSLDCHPCPYFTSCFSTVHTLFLGSHPSSMRLLLRRLQYRCILFTTSLFQKHT